LRGTPKQPIPNVKEVELRVRTDSKFYVESTIIRDLLGGETEWKFSNVKTNGAVSAKTFEFTPPDGTTIVPIATDKLKMQ
jgi:outer membrane lipoprotein-sorting protein